MQIDEVGSNEYGTGHEEAYKGEGVLATGKEGGSNVQEFNGGRLNGAVGVMSGEAKHSRIQ